MKAQRIEQLTSSIEKRFQTTMIGSLARVEDYFGFVWGHNKDMISIEQSDNRNVWQDLRDDILDHCNYQMRAALNDIRKFIQEDSKDAVSFKASYSSKSLQNQGE